MVRKKLTEAVTSEDPKSRLWKTLLAAGRMAYETGEFRQAETLLSRAMEVAKDLPQRVFAMNATTIGIAAVLLAEQRSREADTHLRKSIAELDCSSDSDLQELLAVALRFHAQALIDEGNESEAELELKKSAIILGELGADAGVQMAYTLCDLSGLYLAMGRVDDAEENITDALQILGATIGKETSQYARANMIYKLCLPADDSTVEAAADGIVQMEYFLGYKHPNIARALGQYLRVLKDRGDDTKLDEAKQRFLLTGTRK